MDLKEQTEFDLQQKQWPKRMKRKLAADYLGIAPHTLAVWATNGRYVLPYIKVGSLCYYEKSALDAFLASRTIGCVGNEA